MPQGTIVSSETTLRGQRETPAQYLCDWPGCDNVAEHVLGVVRDIGLFAAICKEHAGLQRTRSRRNRVRKQTAD